MRKSSVLNSTLLILFVSLFLFTPIDGYKRLIVLVVLFSLWLISAFSYSKKTVRATFPLFVLLIIFAIFQYFYSEATGDHDQFRRFFTQNLWTYIWGILGVFYAHHLDCYKRCIPFFAIMIIVSCIFTIVGNITIPGASRMLAGSEKEGSQMYSLLHSMHVGGYGFIYSLVFAVFPCALWIKKRPQKRVFYVLFLVLIMGTIVVGSYFTSIILSILALALSFSNTRNYSSFFIVFGLIALIVIAFKDAILHGLVDFGAFIDSPMLQHRAQQMLDGTYQEAYESAGDYSRWDRMRNAVHNFWQSPLWGRMSNKPIEALPSGHSELLGYFERYGIFACLFLYYYYLIFKRIKKQVDNLEMRLRLNTLFVFFLFFITINTFDIANATGCMVFLIAPCTMLYIESLNHTIEINHSSSDSHG